MRLDKERKAFNALVKRVGEDIRQARNHGRCMVSYAQHTAPWTVVISEACLLEVERRTRWRGVMTEDHVVFVDRRVPRDCWPKFRHCRIESVRTL